MSQVQTKVQTTNEVLPREYKLFWPHVLMFTYFHLAAVYGGYLLLRANVYTLLWCLILYQMSVWGITAGVHRLWSHRSYKAKLPLRIFLLICQTVAQQGSVIGWVHNHRVHHKYSDTDADPHNARRGFFYSHIGWLLVHYHPQFLEKRRVIDLSDLKSDPILVFQKKYFLILMPLIAFIIPAVVPFYFWGESLNVAYHVNVLRYIICIHSAFMINSWAHIYGNKPYDRDILPSNSLFGSVVTQGEGYHNYHHTFPWDYKTSEWGLHYEYNLTTAFINFMAKIGWAYDLKAASPELIKQTMQKRGEKAM